MRVFKRSLCGCQMEYIGYYQYQFHNCGDIMEYGKLINVAKNCTGLFKLLKSK